MHPLEQLRVVELSDLATAAGLPRVARSGRRFEQAPTSPPPDLVSILKAESPSLPTRGHPTGSAGLLLSTDRLIWWRQGLQTFADWVVAIRGGVN